MGVVLALNLGCRTVDRTLHTARVPCGIYRWPVKTLTDPDRGLIRWNPVEATVRDLVVLARPIGHSETSRRSAEETVLYHVTANLVAVHAKPDQDLHLYLRDPSDPTIEILGEIPKPECASGSGHETEFAAGRLVAEKIQSRGRPTMVEVWGIGFFDAPRDQIGGAPNGFELHPIVKLIEISP